jgi:hypothetical protein
MTDPIVSAPIVSPLIVSTPASAEACRNRYASDTVTITISREDAEELLRVAKKREDPYSWMHGGAWAYASELRLRAALEEAVMVETPNLTDPNVKESDHA